jgi:hypothetical protein
MGQFYPVGTDDVCHVEFLGARGPQLVFQKRRLAPFAPIEIIVTNPGPFSAPVLSTLQERPKTIAKILFRYFENALDGCQVFL